MPKVRITETTIYDLDMSWIDPDTNWEYTEEELLEIASEWSADRVCDDDESFQHNPDLRNSVILSATLNMKQGGMEVEIIDEEATNET
ncbi:MAG: hypothetical protein ACREOP_06305 [Thermodesulfobacteriota bacterium]